LLSYLLRQQGIAPHHIADEYALFALPGSLFFLWSPLTDFLMQSQRQNVLEQEFRSAQEIQQILIPEVLPTIAGYAVTSAYHPAQEVGGDFFQIIPLPGKHDNDQSAIIVLGDVSGKGLKAAMTISLLVGSIRSTVETTQDPAQILTALNRRLYGRMQSGFATCFALRLDASGSCTLANASAPRQPQRLPLRRPLKSATPIRSSRWAAHGNSRPAILLARLKHFSGPALPSKTRHGRT
jgi:hypothetical protein